MDRRTVPIKSPPINRMGAFLSAAITTIALVACDRSALSEPPSNATRDPAPATAPCCGTPGTQPAATVAPVVPLVSPEAPTSVHDPFLEAVKINPSTSDGTRAASNAFCPIMPKKAIEGRVTDGLSRDYRGLVVGMCCEDCAAAWDSLDDAERDAALAKVMAPK